MDPDDQPMNERDEGERLLVKLRSVINRADPVPDRVAEAAQAAFTWRTIDAELAELGHDSLVDEPSAAVRSGEQDRLVTFETPRLTIEVEVAGGAGDRRLVGQLDPAGPAELELRTADGAISGAADDLGRFVIILPAARQRASLRCVLPDGGAVETAWLVL
jgi:hypothetical protein